MAVAVALNLTVSEPGTRRTWLFVSILVALMLIATLYHWRRTRNGAIWREEFAAFDWAVYGPRPARGHRGRESIQIEGGKI